jgi:hypothetical protein
MLNNRYIVVYYQYINVHNVPHLYMGRFPHVPLVPSRVSAARALWNATSFAVTSGRPLPAAIRGEGCGSDYSKSYLDVRHG